MEIKIDNRNELFKRQEIVLELESDKNPSFEETKKKLAEKFSKPEENIDVYRIKGNFGKNKFKIEVNIYDSREDLENIKKLERTSKQRKEEDKKEGGQTEESGSEESKEGNEIEEKVEGEVSGEEVREETKSDSAPIEEKMPEEKLEKKPEEAPIEERMEEEQKSIKEDIQKKHDCCFEKERC